VKEHKNGWVEYFFGEGVGEGYPPGMIGPVLQRRFQVSVGTLPGTGGKGFRTVDSVRKEKSGSPSSMLERGYGLWYFSGKGF